MRGFDYRDFRDVIRLRSKHFPGGVRGIADEVGMKESTLYDKIRGKTEFRIDEIRALNDVLHFTAAEKEAIWR
ncbi:MAG: hypothetical protein IKG59_01925 [Firmicutes bacterium]|nr:hypothetical protein [Bacillota bacterium]